MIRRLTVAEVVFDPDEVNVLLKNCGVDPSQIISVVHDNGRVYFYYSDKSQQKFVSDGGGYGADWLHSR